MLASVGTLDKQLSEISTIQKQGTGSQFCWEKQNPSGTSPLPSKILDSRPLQLRDLVRMKDDTFPYIAVASGPFPETVLLTAATSLFR